MKEATLSDGKKIFDCLKLQYILFMLKVVVRKIKLLWVNKTCPKSHYVRAQMHWLETKMTDEIYGATIYIVECSLAETKILFDTNNDNG